MSPLEWALALVMVMAGATVQGSIGFGMNVVASPILFLIEPSLIPGPAIGAATMMTVLMVIRERASIDLPGVRQMLLGAIPGAMAGSFAVAALPQRGLAILFGVLVLVAVAMSVSGWHPQRTRPVLFGGGLLSGFMGTSGSIGGPPVALIWQREREVARIRGSLNGYFLVTSLTAIALLSLVGEFGWEHARSAAMLWPGVVTGFLLSAKAAPLMREGRSRVGILVVSTASALTVLAKALL